MLDSLVGPKYDDQGLFNGRAEGGFRQMQEVKAM